MFLVTHFDILEIPCLRSIFLTNHAATRHAKTLYNFLYVWYELSSLNLNLDPPSDLLLFSASPRRSNNKTCSLYYSGIQKARLVS